MREAITDTGPILHLHEIGWLQALRIFDHVLMPNRVAEELLNYGLDPSRLGVEGLSTRVAVVEDQEWSPLVIEADQPIIHPADAQVFVLVQLAQFQTPVLTDDLALRQRLERQQATVVGTVGVLIRAYTNGLLKRNELENAIDALFTASTLHLSRAFRAYIRHLTANLP